MTLLDGPNGIEIYHLIYNIMVIKKDIHFPLYPAMLTIAFFDDAKELVKTCKLLEDDEEFAREHTAGTIFGAWNKNCNRRIVVIFNMNYPGHLINHGSIAHELYHGMARIFEQIGHTQDPKNNEPEAYLISWMTEQVYDLIKKNRKHLKSLQI